MNQGGSVSPTTFNIVVNAVVHTELQEVCGSQEALPRMGWAAGDQDIMFYADYGRFIGRNPIWVQGTLPTLVRMFGWVGLCTKLGKTKSMTCTPRLIWGQLGKGVYKRRATNEGDTFRERKRTRLSRNNCGRTMG